VDDTQDGDDGWFYIVDNMLQLHHGARSHREEDELIWWPPEPVLELARLAVDSGGDPAAIHCVLDPTIIAVSFV
jgi:hypothetical protein